MEGRMHDGPYVPVDCGFHDKLLERATLQIPADIVYRNEAGEKVRVRDRIVDVFTRQGAEYLRLPGGEEIRLDRLVGVDGEPPGAETW